MRSRWCSGSVCFRSPIREVAEPQAKRSNLHFEDVKETHSHSLGEAEKVGYHNYHKMWTFVPQLLHTTYDFPSTATPPNPSDSDSHPHKTNYVPTAAAAQTLVIRRWAAVIVKTMTKTWWCFKYISDETLNCNMRRFMYALGTFFEFSFSTVGIYVFDSPANFSSLGASHHCRERPLPQNSCYCTPTLRFLASPCSDILR